MKEERAFSVYVISPLLDCTGMKQYCINAPIPNWNNSAHQVCLKCKCPLSSVLLHVRRRASFCSCVYMFFVSCRVCTFSAHLLLLCLAVVYLLLCALRTSCGVLCMPHAMCRCAAHAMYSAVCASPACALPSNPSPTRKRTPLPAASSPATSRPP